MIIHSEFSHNKILTDGNKVCFSQNANSTGTNACHILIVEDHELSAQIVGRFLKQLHCTFDWVATGETALGCYQQNFYDLMLVDIGLPDMSGYELVKKIRETTVFKTYTTPIVALTALEDKESKQSCLEFGMNAAFSKPLLRTTAQEILEVFVPKWQAGKIEKSSTYQSESICLDLTEKPINFEQILALYDQDIDFVKTALEIVMENFKTEQKKLEDAYEKHNWGAIGAITHKLHGVTRYFGMARLGQVCVHFAKILKKGYKINSDDYQTLLNEIENITIYHQTWLKG